MSWTEKFTGLRWEHKNPAVRAQAVAELDDPRLLSALPKIATGDDDSQVRLKALERLNEEAWWLECALADDDPQVRAHADERLPRLFRQPARDKTYLAQRLEWLKRERKADILQDLAVNAADTDMRSAAVERIGAQGFLGDRVIAETDADIAALALAHISQLSTLERIAENLRKHNKRRFNQVQKRLAEVSVRTSHAGVNPEFSKLCREMENLARGEVRGGLQQRFDDLLHAWKILPGEPAEGLKARFEGASRIVADALSAPLPSLTATTTAEDTPEDDTTTNRPHAPLQSLHKRIRAYQREAGQRPDGARVQDFISAWDRAWSLTDTPTPADIQVKQQTLGILAALRDQATSLSDRKERDLGRVNTDLAAIGQALDDGNLADAQQALHTARTDYNRLDQKARRQHAELNQQLSLLYGRLREMRDWQHWSNDKVRKRLIRDVTALPEQNLHPDAITVKLKEARAAWQRLETQEILPGDKKTHASSPWMWRKFQAACQQAYASAKPYFQARESLQLEKHRVIQAFISEAGTHAESETPDYRALEKLLHQARKRIRGLDSIPPDKRRDTAAALRALMDRITERLETHWSEVEKVKQKLVHEAKQLAHEHDSAKAIAAAKQLQKQWQQAGTTRRRQEQALWKAFREPIEPLFSQAKETRKQQNAEARQLQKELEALCREAEALAQSPAGELEAASGRMAGLVQQWQEQKVHDRALRQRFSEAEQTLEQRLLEQDRKQVRALRADGERRVELLQQAWDARQAGSLDEQSAQTLRAAWPVPEEDDSDALAATLQQRFHACLNDEKDPTEVFAGFEDEARAVLIEIEFLAGLPSPDEDKEARMAYQVRRLSEQLAGGEREEFGTEVAALMERWQRCFPLPPAQAPGLLERYHHAVNLLEDITLTT